MTGTHELAVVDSGTAVHNRFVVHGHRPGVERCFESTLDNESADLETAIRRSCSAAQPNAPS